MNIEVYNAMANTNPPLPVAYQNAKQALITCTQLDECKEWADKMAALSSYAKQADNEELELLAKRIRARAMKRAGELLKELDGRGDHWSEKNKSSNAPTFIPTQRQAAEQAGMSKDQQMNAVRVANVPDELFNELVESEAPPTITHLAELGKKTNNIIPIKNETAYAPAIQFRKRLEELYNDHLEKNEPQFYFDGMEDWQKERAKNVIPKISLWLNEFMELLI